MVISKQVVNWVRMGRLTKYVYFVQTEDVFLIFVLLTSCSVELHNTGVCQYGIGTFCVWC